MGPSVLANTILIGFFGFAAIHYFSMWWLSRSERVLLLFSAHCVHSGVLVASLVAITTATSITDYQSALDSRTTWGLLGAITTVWILALTTGVRARPYVYFVTAFSVVLCLVNVFVFPLNGMVADIARVHAPWGEEIAVAKRAPAGWWVPPIYVVVMSVDAFGVYAAWRLWARDRIGGMFVAAASLGGLAAGVAAVAIDVFELQFPYIGDLPYVLWVVLIGLLLSREYESRTAALRKSELRSRLVTDSARLVLWEGDPKTLRFTYVGEVAEQLLGFPRDAWYTADFWKLHVHPDDRDWAIQYCEASTAAKRDHRFEYRMLAADGRVVWVEDFTTLVYENDELVALRGIFADITARKQADEALRESEERFRLGFDDAAIGMGMVAPDGRWLKVNQSLCKIVGYAQDELMAIDFQSLTHPDDLAPDLEFVRRALAGEISNFQMEKRYLHKTGRIVWIHLAVSLVRDAAKRPLYFISQIQDISERKQAEGKLIETGRQNEELVALLDALDAESPVGMAFVDLEYRYIRCNEALAETNGLPVAAHLGRTVEEVVPELWSQLKPVFDGVVTGRTPLVDYEVVGRTAAQPGVDRIWRATYYSVKNRDQVIGIGLIINEVTEKRRMENALTASEARSRAILHALPDLMFHLAADGLILDYSAYDPGELYVSPESFVGKRMQDVVPKEIGDLFVANSERAFTSGQSQHFEYELEIPGHGKQSFEARMAVCCERETITIVRNTSERRNLEERLHQAQKMEAIGRLAGGIAHDFNNVLTVILTHANLLTERIAAGAPGRKSATAILEAAERASKLTRQILAFSRKQAVQPKVLDLNEVVRRADQLLSPMLEGRVELSVQTHADVCPVRIDRTQIEQVLTNLAHNAADAMPQGGRLTISTIVREPTSPANPQYHDSRSGGYVELCVSDTGTGIDDNTKARVFEPFFTTKPPGKGTGLGLAVVHGIVEQCGGHIRVVSEVGAGSSFYVSLPYSWEPPASDTAPREEAARSGCGIILLVDDDEPVREAAYMILAQAGYVVLTAADGEAALAIFEQRGDEIDLLLTDVIMPKIDGCELASRIQARRPDLPVVFMSGYPAARDSAADFLDDAIILEKPYKFGALTTIVRQALDAAAASKSHGR